MKIFSTLFLLSALLAPSAVAQDPAAAPAKKAYQTTDGYPLDKCVVTDEDLDDSAKVVTVEGNTFKACCKKCVAKIEKDPAKFAAKKEAAVIAAQSANYPLDVCAVSGKPLGSMGEPVSLVVDGTLIKLCCKGCNKKAIANKADITVKLQDAAFAKQNANYAGKTCPVSGHDLDQDAVAVMHGTTLVKLCCDDCIAKFKATPNTFVAKLAAPKKAQGEAKGHDKHEAHGEHGKKGEPAPCAEGGCCCDAKAEKKAEGAGGCCQAGETKKPETAPAKKNN